MKGTKVIKQYTVVQNKSVAGLVDFQFKHDVVKTSVEFEWFGPTLSQEVWNEILAFFKWTYETSKSESQVRLFVNSKDKVWKAWAFPQKANTGMAAQEIDNDESKEQQRMMFSPKDGWLYFGTVHHHCSAGAFQSSVDTKNETSQDGIHITVGNMDKDCYSIDYRFYVSSVRIDTFDLCCLWDISEEYAKLPKHFKALLKPGAKAEIAKQMMGIPPPDGLEFPSRWKENIVTPPPTPVATAGVMQNYHKSYMVNYRRRTIGERAEKANEFDYKKAIMDIEDLSRCGAISYEGYNHLIDHLNYLEGLINEQDMNILDIAFRNDMTPSILAGLLEASLQKAEKAKLKLKLPQLEDKPVQKMGAHGPIDWGWGTDSELWP